MRLLLSALLAVALPGLAGCSGDGGPGLPRGFDERVVAEGLAAMYAGDRPDAEDRREGRCFASELLASTDPGTLREGGLVDTRGLVAEVVPQLDAELAGRVADAQLACTDFVADSTAAQVAVTKGRLDRAAYETCLRDALPDDAIRAGVVASLQGAWDDPALTAVTDAQEQCAGRR